MRTDGETAAAQRCTSDLRGVVRAHASWCTRLVERNLRTGNPTHTGFGQRHADGIRIDTPPRFNVPSKEQVVSNRPRFVPAPSVFLHTEGKSFHRSRCTAHRRRAGWCSRRRSDKPAIRTAAVNAKLLTVEQPVFAGREVSQSGPLQSTSISLPLSNPSPHSSPQSMPVSSLVDAGLARTVAIEVDVARSGLAAIHPPLAQHLVPDAVLARVTRLAEESPQSTTASLVEDAVKAVLADKVVVIEAGGAENSGKQGKGPEGKRGRRNEVIVVSFKTRNLRESGPIARGLR